MLLGDMNISRQMIHAQQVKGDMLRNMLKKIGRLGLGTMTILSEKWVVEIACRVIRRFLLQPLHQLVFHPP